MLQASSLSLYLPVSRSLTSFVFREATMRKPMEIKNVWVTPRESGKSVPNHVDSKGRKIRVLDTGSR